MTPYEQGVRDVLSDDPEPTCPYDPGTFEYLEYADGFCHRIQETIGKLL